MNFDFAASPGNIEASNFTMSATICGVLYATSRAFPDNYAGAIEICTEDLGDTTHLPSGYDTAGILHTHWIGGPNLSGERAAHIIDAHLTASPSGNGTAHDYIGLLPQMISGVPAGPGHLDSIYAINPVALLLGSGPWGKDGAMTAGGTGYSAVVGAEFDIGLSGGSEANYLIGVNMVNMGSVEPTIRSVAYQIGGGTGGQMDGGWQYGLLFAKQNGPYPLRSDGVAIAYEGSGVIKKGIDFSQVTITDNFINGPGGKYSVSGTGAVNSVQNTFHQSTAGITGNTNIPVAPNAQTGFSAQNGLYVMRDNTVGGFAVAAISASDGFASILATSGSFSLTDPGPGGNVWYINKNTGSVTNRFTSTHNISYILLAAAGLAGA